MQIVIDINDKVYGLLKYFEKGLGLNDKKDDSDDVKTALIRAVINGTPLPKGHGRLLDEKNILDTENNGGGWYDLVDMPEYIAEVKEIIEADTE